MNVKFIDEKRMEKEISLKKQQELNKKQRMDFVEYWAEYVRTHEDKDWSKQQNVLINSQLRGALQLSRKEYLELKKEI